MRQLEGYAELDVGSSRVSGPVQIPGDIQDESRVGFSSVGSACKRVKNSLSPLPHFVGSEFEDRSVFISAATVVSAVDVSVCVEDYGIWSLGRPGKT
jgi:hypothetical protein